MRFISLLGDNVQNIASTDFLGLIEIRIAANSGFAAPSDRDNQAIM